MEERHISAYKIWKSTGIPQSTLGKWRAGGDMPKIIVVTDKNWESCEKYEVWKI